ncbi:MAG TPA: nucleotidyltransferase domain-containing protein [Thermodesulfovibrionia bacterium]|nr:nucleotidyltransferase domain-containing protein [Thermodesulfovibrionia bacterium]
MINSLDIDALKQYFKIRGDAAFAFLFGSYAKGTATEISDVDIAVYFYPANRHPIEYEEEVFYDGEDTIWDDLEKFLKQEVELVVLNRAYPVIAASAIRGIPLAINDWGLYLDFMAVVTSEAEDFMDFIINDYMEKCKFGQRD